MEYLLGAKARCEFLWIGITQYIVEDLKPTPEDMHRSDPTNNPLTYFERTIMIRNAMVEAGISESQFAIMPFPVETPDILKEFLPTTIPIFTTVYDEWNRRKIEIFEELGYKVIVLWERETKDFEGMQIRQMVVAGDPAWKALVPPATIDIAEQYDLELRLRQLRGTK